MCSSRSAAKARRPTRVWAVIALPTMMPAIGISAMPLAGMVPVASTMASTGSTPAAMASGRPGPGPRRLDAAEVVSTPIANITQTRAMDSARRSMTAAISTAASPSWAMARTAATRTGRSRP